MAFATLKVQERTEKPQVSRRNGFIPGAVFGEGIDKGISVKFEQAQFAKLLKNHVKNAKLQLELGNTNRLCLVKEVQKDVVSGKVLHVDFQAVSENEVVRLKIPINYEGAHLLESRKLLLLPNVTELEVEGKLSVLPDSINVDVSGKKPGDKILVHDLKLVQGVKAHIEEGSILAVVVLPKENAPAEEKAEAAPAEAPAAAGK
ncbi:MAG TPA: 50S ribosomal protein L25 [Clostridia bacterium]|nr:50S ribosomal protein L25 [Clostridia bacterium]